MAKNPSIRPYNRPAGGWDALRATVGSLAEQHVLIKGTKSLFRINQPEGFKCASCAWPDSSRPFPVKFCENGAKALAWEATAERVTRQFFAAHTVSWLEQQSDHWLEEQGRLTEPMVYDESSDKYVPDTEIATRAMRLLNLTVGINTKLNRGHVVHGRKALILPCLGRTELDMQAQGPQMVCARRICRASFTDRSVHGARRPLGKEAGMSWVSNVHTHSRSSLGSLNT